ncbi:hypothetical protein, partial [Kutzneria kofuensis]|uniref:hypothetical protein n=1 Tax=Kutzneria kofuensis TaxID=103725 RepID=UPI0031EEFE10
MSRPDGTLVPVPGGSTFVANAHATRRVAQLPPGQAERSPRCAVPSPEWESFMTTAPWRAGRCPWPNPC